MSARKGWKRIGYFVVFVAAIGLLVLGWYATRPGPFAFASGQRVALASYQGHPTGVPADFGDTDPIARGRYLTEAADCAACHTDEHGTPYAGGRAFKTPFGTLYSPNITPDKATGIGQYTDADFLRTVHTGVARDGKNLYPAFPYESYTYLSDDDVLAIKAYLFSLAPVQYTPPPNALAFPFNQRWLMTFWSIAFNPDKRFEPLPEQSAEWNRGAYMVEALAHCGDCHTPRNLLQGLDNSHKFAGALTNGWRAYNVTPDKAAGIGSWSDDELAQYLASGHAAGRGTASGPMAEAVELSFKNLTASDIKAIVTYLRTVPAHESKDLPAPRTEVASADPKQDAAAASVDPRGKQVFAGACAGCHGWSGTSALSSRATLTGTRAINDPTAVNVAQMILHGSESKDASGHLSMPAFGAAYNDDEVAAVANYVTARFGVASSAITADEVRKMRAME
jgi:mono/diheme cytochrome c family protein